MSVSLYWYIFCQIGSGTEQNEQTTRIMIFSQYRDSVEEITNMLRRHEPKVKAMSFIGQSSAGKATKGFTQKEQLKVIGHGLFMLIFKTKRER